VSITSSCIAQGRVAGPDDEEQKRLQNGVKLLSPKPTSSGGGGNASRARPDPAASQTQL